jgi:hypothetical protein
MQSVAAADPAIVDMGEYTPYAGTPGLVSANRQGRGLP